MTDVRMERIPLLWSTVKERAWAKGFSLNTGDTKYPCVSRRVKLPGRGGHSEKIRETGWKPKSQTGEGLIGKVTNRHKT